MGKGFSYADSVATDHQMIAQGVTLIPALPLESFPHRAWCAGMSCDGRFVCFAPHESPVGTCFPAIVQPYFRTLMTKHPGFKAVQKKIAAKSGVGMKAAGAILASASRNASAKAKRANPRLNRVKGK